TFLENAKESYRLLLGPFTDYSLTQATLDKVKLLGYSSAFIKKTQHCEMTLSHEFLNEAPLT
ncbi:SPOR domain-containing protein, partial [Vibrio parahaemolyticus]